MRLPSVFRPVACPLAPSGGICRTNFHYIPNLAIGGAANGDLGGMVNIVELLHLHLRECAANFARDFGDRPEIERPPKLTGSSDVILTDLVQ